MKLATFEAGGAPELGIVQGDRIVPLSRALPSLAADMIELIARWSQVEGEVRTIAGRAADSLALDQVRLLAPIRRPGKIMAIGLNYADHVAEVGAATPPAQIWFGKTQNTVTGPYDPILLPLASKAVDYEVEMVAVIGKGGKNLSREAAKAAVFGYCVGNDVSVRDWQNRSSQWLIGKCFDTHAPFGPWITTADEVGDPHTLEITCDVNGERRQTSNTSNLIFDVYDQVMELSQAMTLEPGDLIFTGTPGGVGVAKKPPLFLKAGDRVVCEIPRLGRIEAVTVQET